MKIYICLGIIYKLMNGERLKASFLAREFEVCTRTIYRCLNYIECAGFPLVSYAGKNGGYELLQNNKINNSFTQEDVNLIISAIDLLPKNAKVTTLKQKMVTCKF